MEKREIEQLVKQKAASELDRAKAMAAVAGGITDENKRREALEAEKRTRSKGVLRILLGDAQFLQEYKALKQAGLEAQINQVIIEMVAAVLGLVDAQAAPANTPEATKAEAPDVEAADYEELTDAEIQSLPIEVKSEFQNFIDLHNLLEKLALTKDPDKAELLLELVKDKFDNAPRKKLLALVLSLNLITVEDKLINFVKKVLARAQKALAPAPKATAPTPSGAPTSPNVLRTPGQKFVPSEHALEHRDRTTIRDWYHRAFQEAVESPNYGDEAAYQFLIDAANDAMTQFLDSGSAQSSAEFGKQFLALWDVLKDFNPDRKDSQKTRPAAIRSWGSKPDNYETDRTILGRYELAQKLRDKGLEILFLSYIAEFAIKHGTPKSLVSDWSHLLEMEKADTDNFGTGVDMFDFFLSDGKEKRLGSYGHANVFTYIMWMMPELIRGVEEKLGSWNDGYPGDHEAALTKAIRDKLKEIRGNVNASGRWSTEVAQHRKPGESHGRWGMDKAVFTFSAKDLEGLDDKDAEFEHLIKYATLFGTATGVRQHLFLNNLARGATPGGAMSDNKDWMVKCSRFALANYQCYKGAVPHPLVEGFQVSWPAKVEGGKTKYDAKQNVIVTSILQTENVLSRVMVLRKERVDLGTLQDNGALSDVRYPLETSYPDLYSFVVRAHQRRSAGDWIYDSNGNVIYEDEIEYKMITLPDGRRVVELDGEGKPVPVTEVVRIDNKDVTRPKIKRDAQGRPIKKKDEYGNLVPARESKKPAKFEAFIAGLNAMDDFVSTALKVPGGTSDKEKIKGMKPKELRAAMLKDLVDLIQKKVSPLKANEYWVNWRHVVQYILMFVDRMYRVYKLCDDTPDGRGQLTHEIRQTFAAESYNLIISAKPSWLREGGTQQAREYQKGQAVKVSGLNRSKLDAGRFAGVVMGGEETTVETKKDKIDLRDWILSRIPELDSPSIGPEARPVYTRIIGQASGPKEDKLSSVQRVRGPVGSSFETKGALAIDNIMHNGAGAFTNLWHDYVNVGAIPNFQKGIWQVVIGTPAEEQKKVADEKK